MTDFVPATELKRLLEAHGLTCETENDWVVPNAELPAIRALWHPREQSGRLDIQVFVGNDVVIEECFAGMGQGAKAFDDALHNFSVNSLHVLLAGFWGENDATQVMTANWRIGQRDFTAYVGNFGTRASGDDHPKIPDALFDAIATTLKKETLVGDLHWVRMFFCNVAGQHTFEALLDNEEWPAGVACLKAIPWESGANYFSVRNFILLRAE